MNAKRKKKSGTYSDLHASLMGMTEHDVRVTLRTELNRTDRPARIDYVQRLVGRYNRLRAQRTMAEMLALLSIDGKRDTDSVLDRRTPAPAKKTKPAKLANDAAPAGNG